ncbi:MAG: hypothetical protein ACK417_05800 [Bacteroidia bacterium]
MNKIFKSALMLAFVAVSLTACKDEGEDPITPGTELEVLQGDLESMTLDASKKYLIRGTVFVRNGKVLTIPAGTVLIGEKRTKGTLVIDKGGRIEANGTANAPVVMTSNQETFERDKGDWGGLVILGRANCNQNNPAIEGITPEVTFGTFQSTEFDNESSGTLRYLRVEYAGIALSPNNETNSITMGGMGRGTEMEYCMVSYGGDDGFEWFGGTADARYLVSHGTWDDDFDCDFGWTGRVQFALAVRDPFAADQSGSNGFECDNEAGGNDVQPYTSGIFSNVTILGPRHDSLKSAGNQHSANYQHAMHLRRRTAISIFNSVMTGFPTGFRLDGATTEAQYTSGVGTVANNIYVAIGGRNNPALVAAGSGNDNASVLAYWNNNNNTFYTDGAGITVNGKTHAKALTDAGVNPDLIMGFRFDFRDYPNNPNFATFTGATQTGSDFSNSKLGGGYFQNVPYRGAFGGTDWTDGWAAFFPQGVEY